MQGTCIAHARTHARAHRELRVNDLIRILNQRLALGPIETLHQLALVDLRALSTLCGSTESLSHRTLRRTIRHAVRHAMRQACHTTHAAT